MRFQKLDLLEEKTLTDLVQQHPNDLTRKRAQSILLSKDKFEAPHIARLLEVRTRTIYSWFDRFERMGFLGLLVENSGKTAKLSVIKAQQQEKILKWIDKGESLERIAYLFSKTYKLDISTYMIRTWIKKNQIEWKRITKYHKNKLEIE
ncbi:helix-turn-helix domain-containing protein [Emticicia sp. 17c]|uniref:helix-turn-helix domain-containing protein n=1 Tax=Emticicia sp. 17c TaxID=3127704 RepID=UPI00301C0647